MRARDRIAQAIRLTTDLGVSFRLFRGHIPDLEIHRQSIRRAHQLSAVAIESERAREHPPIGSARRNAQFAQFDHAAATPCAAPRHADRTTIQVGRRADFRPPRTPPALAGERSPRPFTGLTTDPD